MTGIPYHPFPLVNCEEKDRCCMTCMTSHMDRNITYRVNICFLYGFLNSKSLVGASHL